MSSSAPGPRAPETPAPQAAAPGGELARERAYAAACRDAMAALVRGAAEHVVTGEDVSGDGASAEALGRYLRSRAKELAEAPDGPPFFGRLDFGDEPEAGDHRGQRYYVGRRRLSEHPSAPPLVVDWRAPVSRAFYQAGPKDRRGVRVRRRFGWAASGGGAPQDLTGYEDEPLGGPRPDVPGRLGATGSSDAADAPDDALGRIVAAEIERPRVGPMRDIVSTIQPEQDDLVRAPLAASVCVQGAPGTGKTAVGLHRAAYLLYTHPQRIQRSGLLVIGPNRTFLRYIAEVLPALGEADVRQCTVEDLYGRHPVRAEDTPEAAAVKQSARMAAVLERALYDRVRVPEGGGLAVPDGSYRWRVPADELAAIIREVRAEAPPYAVGRERVRSRVVAAVRDQAERRAGPPGAAWVRAIGGRRAVRDFLDAAWPPVRPDELVASLLGDPAALARAAGGLLTERERAAIAWRRPVKARSAKWTVHDLVLIDEVAGLIEHPEGYGHIVVDEAQDLSPMQCRAIARRSAFGSLTVLGDLAQGTTPWAARDWREQLAHLGEPDAAVVPLTTGYRVPRAVADLANRLLGTLNVDVPPTHSLRRDGELTVRRTADLPRAAAEAVAAALAREGSVAVLTPDTGPLADGLPLGEHAASPRLTVLPAARAKGLEFDHVIVLEPAEIATAPRGAHHLYVALTRAVSRLDVLHTAPLPEPLRDAPRGG